MVATVQADTRQMYCNAIILSVITKSDETHPKGKLVGGVPWQDGFIVTTATMRNAAPPNLRVWT
jgi:hypothetical protein